MIVVAEGFGVAEGAFLEQSVALACELAQPVALQHLDSVLSVQVQPY